MLKLSNLIQKIDYFYHNAIKPYELQKIGAMTPEGTWVPDEDDEDEDGPPTARKPQAGSNNELVNTLYEIAREIEDPSAVEEALIIADMYGKALEMNDGFNYIKQYISTALNELLDKIDEDDEENPLNALEETLNKVRADATARAKTLGTDKRGDSQASRTTLRSLKDQLRQDDVQQAFQEQSSFMPAKHGPGGGKEQMEVAPGVFFDPTGGVGMEEGKTQGTGVGFRGRHILKDWKSFYEGEKERYLDELKSDKDPQIADKKKKLVGVLDQLLVAYKRVNDLDVQYQTAPDEIGKMRLDLAKDHLSKLKKERAGLKASLRSNSLSLQLDELANKYHEIAGKGASIEDIKTNLTLLGDPANKAKFIMYQEMELRNLLRSQDKNKGEETKYRKGLLAALPHMTISEIGLRNIKDILTKIDEAARKKIPIEQVRIEEADQKAKEMGKIRIKDPGLYSIKHLPESRDYGKVRAAGFAKNITDDLAALKSNVKDPLGSPSKMHKTMTEAERQVFKPYLDAIADAFTKKDRAKVRETVRVLRPLLQQYVQRTDMFMIYVVTIKISRELYNYRDMLLNIAKFEEKPNFSPEETDIVRKTIAEGDRLHNYMANLKFKRVDYKNKVPFKRSKTYDTMMRKIEHAKEYLEKILNDKGV